MNQLYDLICLRSTKQEIMMELAFMIWPLNFSGYQTCNETILTQYVCRLTSSMIILISMTTHKKVESIYLQDP